MKKCKFTLNSTDRYCYYIGIIFNTFKLFQFFSRIMTAQSNKCVGYNIKWVKICNKIITKWIHIGSVPPIHNDLL